MPKSLPLASPKYVPIPQIHKTCPGRTYNLQCLQQLQEQANGGCAKLEFNSLSQETGIVEFHPILHLKMQI